ncbi:MAG: type II toxin-antitoxin system RelE/ParE family toxin [bacterium]
MRVRFTNRYVAQCRKIPSSIRERAEKQLRLLLQNPQHPSLRLHKMRGYTNMWEISVTIHYRIMFQIEGDEYVLLKIGPHDVLDKH